MGWGCWFRCDILKLIMVVDIVQVVCDLDTMLWALTDSLCAISRLFVIRKSTPSPPGQKQLVFTKYLKPSEKWDNTMTFLSTYVKMPC